VGPSTLPAGPSRDYPGSMRPSVVLALMGGLSLCAIRGAAQISPEQRRIEAELGKPLRAQLIEEMLAWRPVLFSQDGYAYARDGRRYDEIIVRAQKQEL